MLRFLSIENIAVIEKCTVNFDDGFIVLSGETGAGKSVIINSLCLLMGERASKDLIRNGETYAKVEGVFDATEFIKNEIKNEIGIEVGDDDIVISRKITMDGKNDIRLNGSYLTLSMLKQIGHLFINIHGQHESTLLLNKKTHLSHLDAFGAEKIKDILSKYEEINIEYNETDKKIESLKMDEQEKIRKLDILSYQIEEIEVAGIKEGEEEELEQRRLILSNAQKIAENANGAFNYLYEGDENTASSYDTLWSAIKLLENVSEFDKSIKEVVSSLTDCAYIISDSAKDIKHHFESMNFDPYELGQVEERLNAIYLLKKKYGNTEKDILLYLEKIKAELEQIENNDEEIKKLTDKKEKLEIKRLEYANNLTMLRKNYAKILGEKIKEHLFDLEMKNAQFEVEISETDFTKTGKDNVEFLISTNPGEALKPLVRVASGGELSRVILSIKTILSDKGRTIIFDEVDTGVSGKVAHKIAEKLYSISLDSQVICITHLPQIACFSDMAFLIKKEEVQGRTKTSINLLDENKKTDEIARLLGGEVISDVTKENAKELINNANSIKKTLRGEK